MLFRNLVLALTMAVSSAERFNEVKILDGHTERESVASPVPHTYLQGESLPDAYNWGDIDGKSYLTHSLNQHLPQYCGSCWAHGALSSLADRIKIARGAVGDDINLSIQYILNCGADVAGSCHGGYHTGVYQLIKESGFVPYDTCQPYLACSDESTEGFCKSLDTTCKKENICRTCDTFGGMGGKCTSIDYFPNATVAEYGTVESGNVDAIMAEIYTRGPVAATINAEPIVEYGGGIYADVGESKQTNHIVSIVGWGKDEESGKKHWIVRNSWGVYWGEMGYIRVEMGQNLLGLEGEVAWATPGTFTEINFPCSENGNNCHVNGHVHEDGTTFYVDPSNDVQAVQRRLLADNVDKLQKNLRSSH
jgi:cathepsin X